MLIGVLPPCFLCILLHICRDYVHKGLKRWVKLLLLLQVKALYTEHASFEKSSAAPNAKSKDGLYLSKAEQGASPTFRLASTLWPVKFLRETLRATCR